MATSTSSLPKKIVASYGAAAKPTGGGFETFSWYFLRISGIALIFLVIIHLLLMHVMNDVSATTYCFVAARYANPFWRGYDLLLLTLALPHGLNGLRLVADDYIQSRTLRLAVVSSLFIVAIFFWLLGSATIITFQPAASAHCVIHP